MISLTVKTWYLNGLKCPTVSYLEQILINNIFVARFANSYLQEHFEEDVGLHGVDVLSTAMLDLDTRVDFIVSPTGVGWLSLTNLS